jgi:hypothetical protein
MPILLTETLVSPTKATHHMPGRPHVSTVWRYMGPGCRGIRLESIVCGGRRFTSIEAIERFIAATTAAANREPISRRTPAQRQRAIEQAQRELNLDGPT